MQVGAASPDVPLELVEQLKVGGKMVVPVGEEDGAQELLLVERTADEKPKVRRVTGVRYVPLTDLDYQLKHRK